MVTGLVGSFATFGVTLTLGEALLPVPPPLEHAAATSANVIATATGHLTPAPMRVHPQFRRALRASPGGKPICAGPASDTAPGLSNERISRQSRRAFDTRRPPGTPFGRDETAPQISQGDHRRRGRAGRRQQDHRFARAVPEPAGG